MPAPASWTVPGYTEVRTLGTGAGGRVVLAVHQESGSQVAVKYLSERLRAQAGFLERFRDEARLLVELDDPHIAQLYEYMEAPQGAAIVMEVVNGAPLRLLLHEQGATGPEAALAVLKGSLLGLAAAHEQGVVHRDYKPENVVVRGDGSSKLVDFGIAVRAGETIAPAGTPAYMAPEQWAGHEATPATDVYAATAVFFECLTGQLPYQASEHAVMMHLHQTADIPIDQAPEPLRGLIERGMAKDPARRPASASLLVAELEDVAVAAYGPDWETKGRKRLAALAAGVAALWPLNRQPEPEVATALARTTLHGPLTRLKKHWVRLAATVGAVVIAAGGVTAYALGSADRTGRTDPIAAAPATPSPTLVTDPAAPPAPPSPSPSESPSESPSKKPWPKPSKKPEPSKTPHTERPSPKPTPTPPTTVTSVQVGGLALGAGAKPAATGTVTVITTGTAKVTLTVKFVVLGKTAGTQSMTLSGAKKYVKAVSQSLGSRPCGGAWSVTGTATGGKTGTTSASLPDCPTKVTGLSVLSLTLDPKAVKATAKVQVTADGTGQIDLTGDFSTKSGAVNQQVAHLSGQTSYTRTFTFTFGKPVCDGPVTFTASTNPAGPKGSAAKSVTGNCPASVTSVSVTNLSRVLVNASATVAVRTGNGKPVQVTVTWLLNGKANGSQTVTLSGKTAYATTVKFSYPRLPCGKTWGVTVTTVPAPPGGAVTVTKKTDACLAG
ncbi:serine/threonine protein kinase [Streptosporangiaceae bacterium NEAU-GS5]|nr:serine/threonine protein kinase [Streptosporangiaceae bacterium NEAU-GS5]